MTDSTANTPQADTDADTLRDFAARVLRAEADAVASVIDQLGDSLDAAVKLVAKCKGTVIVSGMGKSGIIAQKISATLASTGSPSHYLHPTEAMHGDLGRIRAGDVVVLLSYSGTTDEILSLAALVRQDRVPIVAMCAREDCHLARLADVTLCIGDVAEACPHNLAPTASTTAMLALGDALALAVSRQRNFSADDFKKRHPGGQLGRLMMPIMDVLRFRAGDNLPLIRDDITVAEVEIAAEQYPRRAGAVILVDAYDRMTGIFTDADLRRLIVKHGPDGLRKPIADVMTRSPRCLTDDSLVRDAVQLTRELRLDEIPVVDADGKPVGMIDVQDLIALKVIEA
ncbi:MAG: KpsF/GutQ family sugar-phosphate isomerase [Phycisphaera sp.]|nr:KpsF/GutQ family sugar-phosphate isomerase [Phycisphaera sp.]